MLVARGHADDRERVRRLRAAALADYDELRMAVPAGD
jgi:hypothetical protein